MATAYNKLNELQKQFYGSISFGGSDGNIVLSDSAENKWIGLYIGVQGTLKVTKANGQVQEYQNFKGFFPGAVSKVWANVSTGTVVSNVIGQVGWSEEILDVYE